MPTLEDRKKMIHEQLPLILEKMNAALRGESLEDIVPILMRIDHSGTLPSWFSLLQSEHRLPNLDGKTIGSVIEKLLVCVLERYVYNGHFALSINPARGVDIPELELGVKSPSTNYDTSEPYFSAYERLLGNEYDAIVLLTNYQEAKTIAPFNLQILKIKYLRGSEIADANLCATARALRNTVTNELELKKAIRFLAYINHSDWEANCLLKLINKVVLNNGNLSNESAAFRADFEAKNRRNIRDSRPLLPLDSLERLNAISEISPVQHAVISAAEDWVIITQKDNGRYPNDNEWNRIMTGPLDGKISMSFALQWRYNFRCLFNK